MRRWSGAWKRYSIPSRLVARTISALMPRQAALRRITMLAGEISTTWLSAFVTNRFWILQVSLLRASSFLPVKRERQSSVDAGSACDGRQTFLLKETGDATFVGDRVVDMVPPLTFGPSSRATSL